jgi:O-acetylhomoserine (thiol)-lyase
MPTNSKHPETLVLHSGYRSDPTTTAVAVPIYQTTSFQFHNTQHAANLFALAELGNIYSRIGNPTCDVLETRLAALEGGVAGLALGSGQAASLFAVQNICHAGDNFVASTDLYGGTWNLFANTMKTMGIECRFVDPADPENFRRATDERTRCYYAETAQPQAYGVPNRRGGEDRSRARCAPNHGQHGRTRALPTARPWCSDRAALDHQVYRRPRYIDRRHPD